MKIYKDVDKCFSCPYKVTNVDGFEFRCSATKDNKLLSYEDEFVRVPDWCPFNKEVEE